MRNDIKMSHYIVRYMKSNEKHFTISQYSLKWENVLDNHTIKVNVLKWGIILRCHIIVKNEN